jgi:hypothetical protein
VAAVILVAAILVAAILVAAISLGTPEWAHGAANAGAVETGAVETGAVETGVAETGAVAIGTIGTATMSSSSVTSAFHGGGVGAGVRHGAGAIHTDTDIMVLDMTAATDTVMDTATGTATPATVMVRATVMDTATAAGPEWPSYSVGLLEPVITAGPLTASWDRRPVERFGLTSAIAETQVDQVSFA